MSVTETMVWSDGNAADGPAPPRAAPERRAAVAVTVEGGEQARLAVARRHLQHAQVPRGSAAWREAPEGLASGVVGCAGVEAGSPGENEGPLRAAAGAWGGRAAGRRGRRPRWGCWRQGWWCPPGLHPGPCSGALETVLRAVNGWCGDENGAVRVAKTDLFSQTDPAGTWARIITAASRQGPVRVPAVVPARRALPPLPPAGTTAGDSEPVGSGPRAPPGGPVSVTVTPAAAATVTGPGPGLPPRRSRSCRTGMPVHSSLSFGSSESLVRVPSPPRSGARRGSLHWQVSGAADSRRRRSHRELTRID